MDNKELLAVLDLKPTEVSAVLVGGSATTDQATRRVLAAPGVGRAIGKKAAVPTGSGYLPVPQRPSSRLKRGTLASTQ